MKLFKKDSSGKIRTWTAEVNGASFRTITGIVDGTIVESAWTTTEPKNTGKKNATTAEEQALAEVEALRAKYLRGDYHERIEDVDIVKHIKPMLATVFDKRVSKIKWDKESVIIQPKLDGIRMIATSNGFFTRTGKAIKTVPHIEEALKPVFEEYPDLVLDGELYNHALCDEFQKLVSLIKREEVTPEQLQEVKELVQYHIYDVAQGHDGSYSERHELLAQAAEIANDDCVRLVGYEPVTAPEEVYTMEGDNIKLGTITEKFIECGYEGSMVRIDSAPYAIGKRSSSLMKFKKFDDAEFEVIDFKDANGQWVGAAKVAIIKLPDGRVSVATMRGTMEELQAIWKDKDDYIGALATVQYFGKTDAGELRFPTVKILHKTERM